MPPEIKFAFPHLMEMKRPRADGLECAPLMQPDYDVPGLMVMQTPRADLYATMEACGKSTTATPFIVDLFDFLYFGENDGPYEYG